METCNGRRVRTWARGGAGGAPARVAEDRAPGSQAPAYLSALQALLPDGYPASVTPDYLRACPSASCPLPSLELHLDPSVSSMVSSPGHHSCLKMFPHMRQASCRCCKSVRRSTAKACDSDGLIMWSSARRLPGVGLCAGAVLVRARHAHVSGAAGGRRRRARGQCTERSQKCPCCVLKCCPRCRPQT